MPELPEVEIALRNLMRWAKGREVLGVAHDPRGRRIFRPTSPAALSKAIHRRRFEAFDRIGKNLLLTFSGSTGALSHLGMTGKWLRRPSTEEPPPHARLSLTLSDGRTLHYVDPRLFGRFRLVPGARFEDLPELAALGPDPLREGIEVARLAAAFGRSARPVKLLVMDQALLPGVGNIQASESLFLAQIDPRRPSRTLSRAEVARIAASVLRSIRQTIARDESPEPTYVEEPGAPNPFRVYGRAGERCPRCKKGVIVRAVQGQRSSFYCPRCQR